MHTIEDVYQLLEQAEPGVIEQAYQWLSGIVKTNGQYKQLSAEEMDIDRTLDACWEELNNPNAVFLSADDVFSQIRAELRAA